MVFCNEVYEKVVNSKYDSHNPYFNRWFSAMPMQSLLLCTRCSHNPYFNRWFSAIMKSNLIVSPIISHNPYFNRWFSAIKKTNLH